MLVSQFSLATLKETPADAEIISHQLMLRAGLIRRLSSGLYSWLPLGLRVLQKVKTIIREELDATGALEIQMPMVQPAEIWQESERWETFGKELLKIQDRHERDFCVAPTHEEAVTDLARQVIQSYKQLPLVWYQIQTKFRDEMRPRSGVMRAREFVMKDAYSFHMDMASLATTYQTIYDAYCRIFTRLGLHFKPVLADTGSMGGQVSHEFQVIAESGEDVIAYCPDSGYAANLERAEALVPESTKTSCGDAMLEFSTPNANTIDAVCALAGCSPADTIKTLIVQGVEPDTLVALILRGDHTLNEVKAANHAWVNAQPFAFASDAAIQAAMGCPPGTLGPVDCPIPMIIDRAAMASVDFICGANKPSLHLKNVNWERDITSQANIQIDIADIRQVEPGDLSPDGQGTLSFVRSIEVGHVFQLGDKYSRSMNLTVLDDAGQPQPVQMGCYGIGVSRIIAATIEQHHDDRGIIWPLTMAPFQVGIVPMQYHKSYRVREAAMALYEALRAIGLEVLLDDRKARPGVLFADMDLIGIPHRVVISERGLDQGEIEYKARTSRDVVYWPKEEVVARIKTMIDQARL